MNPYQQGREAYLGGKYLNDNPYFSGSNDWRRWHQGWLDAEQDWECK